jgi:hypothetical protein
MDALEAELAYLDNDTVIVPEALPLSVEALSRRSARTVGSGLRVVH